MRSSYDRNNFTNSNIFNNNINSSRNFFGNSSKLENLQNLYFSLNPYAKSTSINSNQQLRLLKKFQSDTDENALDKKYGKPIINNYSRFHLKAEEIKKGKGKSLDKNTLYTNYTPEAKNNPNLAFYSLADLSTLHPLTYQKMKSSERYLTSGNLKNYTRLQMVDEKLKKLEEKNEALQTINNIFFDSLKDNLTQSLKRKAFLRKHLKDIEYLKQVNLEEYNEKVKYLMDLVEGNEIDFDNYNFEGEPLSGIENLAGQVEALKTEIGTMLTKNTMKNDINLNFLKQDVIQVRDELEKKLMEFSETNNKNYEILKEYLYREEKDRLAEKRRRKQNRHSPAEDYIPETSEKFEIKGIKPKLEIGKQEEEEKSTEEEVEESEVSTETNKNIDVIDKILLDSMSLSMTTNGKNVKDKKSTTKSKKSSKSNKEEDNVEEKEIELTSSSKNTNTKSKKSKWKLLQESSESNLDNKEPEDVTDNKEIKEEDENNENNIILGSYKSKFDSNKPEFLSKSKRSKKSKKFKLSKETTEPKEKSVKTETKKESSSKTKEEIKSPSEKKEEEKEEEEEDEDDKIMGTESSSVTTESFKLTNRSNKVNLNNIKEHQEVLLGSESSKKKSDNEKKSKKSRKSKKSKKKSRISDSIKEKSKEEEED